MVWDPDVGVEVEAIELGLAGAAGGDVTEVRLVTEAADPGAGAGAEGDAALDGGAECGSLASLPTNLLAA